MSVDPSSLAAAALQLPSALSGTAPLLRFQADGQTQRSLDLGQTLQARVTQAFQGGRYLVDFGGQERVIDSTVPLRIGDMLRARVISVGEQVVLEKMLDAPATKHDALQDPTQPAPPAWLQRMNDEAALALFRQHASLLSPVEWQALGAQAGQLDANKLVLSALALKRAGFAPDPLPLQCLGRALAGASLIDTGQQQLSATLVAGASGIAQTVVRENAHAVATAIDEQLHAAAQPQVADPRPEGGAADEDMDEREQGRWAWIAQRLLNAQQPGALAHRTMSLPLAIDGRLVEFQVALFDVSDGAELSPELRQRSLRISLDLDHLGHIEFLARVVDQHLALDVLAASDEAAIAMGNKDHALSRALAELGWTVDAVTYAVKPTGPGNALVRTVMERLVAGDNFNMVA